MAQIMPKGTKCSGCNQAIAITDLFVGYRFGGEVRFWHNRSRVVDDCWGAFLLEHVLRVHTAQTGKINQKRPPTRPIVH
jgi:hypothetical protein